MNTANIIAYQIDGSTCRFVYQGSTESLEVVSIENYRGMKDFLSRFGNHQIDKEVDIYEWVKEQEERVKSFDMFEVLNKIW